MFFKEHVYCRKWNPRRNATTFFCINYEIIGFLLTVLSREKPTQFIFTWGYKKETEKLRVTQPF